MNNFFIALFCFYALRLSAQDPHFTQFYANPLYTNPAGAGTAFYEGAMSGRGAVQFRNQGPGGSLNYRILSLGWDQPIDAVKGGFGALFTSDAAASGFVTTNSLLGNYAYSLTTGPNTRLRFGLQAGWVVKKVNFNKIIFDGNMDPNLMKGLFGNTYPNQSIQYPAFNSGMLFTGKNYFLGAAIFHLNKPNISFYSDHNAYLTRRIALHFGYSFLFSDQFSITPMVQFQTQASTKEGFGGVLCHYRKLLAGLWYRQNFGQFTNADAVALNLGVDIKNFRLNYSFDRSVSDARNSLATSHEISLQYRWKTKQSRELESAALY